MTWYVVSYWDTQNDADKIKWADSKPEPEDEVWTISKDPNETGWSNDMDSRGYGLTYADAKELADAANKAGKK